MLQHFVYHVPPSMEESKNKLKNYELMAVIFAVKVSKEEKIFNPL